MVTDRPLDLEQVMELGTQIADGWMRRTAKALGIATLRRGTFLFGRAGQAKILDFGLAKLTSQLRPEEAVQAMAKPLARVTSTSTSPGVTSHRGLHVAGTSAGQRP